MFSLFLSGEEWRAWAILHLITGENGGCGQQRWAWLPNFRAQIVKHPPMLNPRYATANCPQKVVSLLIAPLGMECTTVETGC